MCFPERQDSMRRFHAILQLCQQLGVETAPAEAFFLPTKNGEKILGLDDL